jgi:dienelactone hydrolase
VRLSLASVAVLAAAAAGGAAPATATAHAAGTPPAASAAGTVAAATAARPLALAPAAPASAAVAAQVRSYDLGRISIPTPGPFGPIPVRLRGAIGAPVTQGPHPVVAVLHGRNETGCPVGMLDSDTWPCFRRENRYDLGMRHVVRSLAERGIVAVAPSLGGAFTSGWGEPNDADRWPKIVNRTLGQIAREADEGGGRFRVPLQGRVNLRRIGLLGHSLSGHHSVRAARRRAGNTSPGDIGRGRGPIRSLFLLTPVAQGAVLPDVGTAILLASCDGDTGPMGRTYLKQARRQENRTRPVVLARLEGANHNYFNRKLEQLGADDAPRTRRCRRPQRLTARAQQRWLDLAAADFFGATLLGQRRPTWLRLGAPVPRRVYGRHVLVCRTG